MSIATIFGGPNVLPVQVLSSEITPLAKEVGGLEDSNGESNVNRNKDTISDTLADRFLSEGSNKVTGHPCYQSLGYMPCITATVSQPAQFSTLPRYW